MAQYLIVQYYYFTHLKQNIMFEQLMQMIQGAGKQSVVENTEVPNEHNEAIMQEAHNAIANGLQQVAASGDVNQFAQNPQALADHPAMQNVSGNFMGSIMQKFGLSQGAASGIAASLIPMVMSKITSGQQAGAQGGGGFNLGGLLSSFTGRGAAQPGQAGGGIMDSLSSIGAKLGLDKDGDGDVDLNDLKKLI